MWDEVTGSGERGAAEVARAARVCDWAWRRGWAERNAGNLSVDLGELGGRGRCLLVSAAGARLRDIADDPRSGLVIVEVSPRAGERVVWGPPGLAPTSELPTHLAAHRSLGTGVALLHSHPTDLVALNHTDYGSTTDRLSECLWSVMPEVRLLLPEGVGVVPYLEPGSEALAAATAEALTAHRVVVWDMHGAVSRAADLAECFDLLDVCDKAARIVLRCLAAGAPPRGMGRA